MGHLFFRNCAGTLHVSLTFMFVGVRQSLKANSARMSLDDLERVFMNTKGKALQKKAWCVVCNAYCEVRATTLHVAGTPCVAWSTMGSRCGATGGTVLCFLVCLLRPGRLIE